MSKASLVHYGRSARTILTYNDSIEVEDDFGNVIHIEFPGDGTIDLRLVGSRLSHPIVVRPRAANAVTISASDKDLGCRAEHKAYGHCFLQRFHEGDHRGNGSQYWTWSNTDAQRT